MLPTRLLAFFLAAAGATPIARAEDAATTFHDRVLPILQNHCIQCHGAEKPKAKVNVSGERGIEQLAADRDLWFRVLAKVESGEMPPEDEKPLSDAERKAVVEWVRGGFTEMMAARQMKEGRSHLRRLTRHEYENTYEDLFGVRPDVQNNLPEDGKVSGYDKVAGALPMSASGAFGYFKMAEDALKWVLKPLPKEFSPVVRAEAMESGQSPGHTLVLEDKTMVSFNSDVNSGRLKFGGVKVPGLHRMRCSVYGYQTDKPMPFGIYVGNTGAYPQILDLVAVLEAPPGKAAVVEASAYLRAGIGMRLIPFGIGVQVPKNTQAKNCKGPGLAVQWVEVEQPQLPLRGEGWLTADFPPALVEELRRNKRSNFADESSKGYRSKVITRDEYLKVLRTTFERVGARFYRRDLAVQEVDAMLSDAGKRLDEGASLETAFSEKIIDMMTSPDFLCVVETPGKLNDFALASRLSYFLWNSTPDEVLLDLARKGALKDPAVLREQTERLLKDPKSSRFIADFSDQWLGLRTINDTSPDGKLYPEYSELLKHSSLDETRAFLRKLVDENLSVRHFVSSPWALVNEPLAKHYGLPDVKGTELRKVDVPETSPFGGLWTQSSILKVTANGTNTSPVKRGVWVAERLLGTPIPPPPPDIKPVEPDVRGAKTLREQLALHSSGGSCTACHAKFDPYGFALESFDPMGGFRKNYREMDAELAKLPANQRKGKQLWRDGLPVDSAGKMPDGQAFGGIGELRKILAASPEKVARGAARHLVTYATGTPVSPLDDTAVEQIVKASAKDDYGLRSLIHAVVQSEIFQSK